MFLRASCARPILLGSYALPGFMDSLHTHPPNERLQGFVCDPSFMDRAFVSECRGAMALIRQAQEQDMLESLRTPDKPPASPSTVHRDNTPAPPGQGPPIRRTASQDAPLSERRQKSSPPPPASTWRPSGRPPPTGPRADRVRQAPAPQASDVPPSPPRKRSPEPYHDTEADEKIRELKAKVRRLEDSCDAAQARTREMRDELDAARERVANMPAMSDMVGEIFALKARAQRAETRERRLNTWLKDVLADELDAADSLDLDGQCYPIASQPPTSMTKRPVQMHFRSWRRSSRICVPEQIGQRQNVREDQSTMLMGLILRRAMLRSCQRCLRL
ncbi:hypothetical protein PENSPDRAFT_173952 [Peniophora sp. CONT]|nr:hypothetical protein PENSPDRAFT_173952 [Peniophora sp. CONT]